MPQFFNTISEVAKNYKRYDDWEQKQDDLEAKKIYLNKKMPLDKAEFSKLKQKAETVTRVTEIMDARSEDNSQDIETITATAIGIGLPAILIPLNLWVTKALNSAKYNSTKNSAFRKFGPFIPLVATFVLSIGGILWSNSKTKEASRLGRYQAKIHDLKDVKNFVQFTPEQIAQAEEIAKSMPDIKKRNSIMQSIHNVKEMLQDGRAYKDYKKKKSLSKSDKPVKIKLSPEQIKQAKADKELLLNVIKKINNKAEDYTENTENAFDTIQMVSWLGTIPIGLGLNKLFKSFKWKIPSGVVATGVSVLFPIAVSIWSLIAEKKASRVGRFKARQEIQKNPEILRSFSDEELKEAENIKAPNAKKGFFARIGENFKFIGTYIKDKKEYDNYKKTTAMQNEKLNNALLKVKVTDEQVKEAKHLQDKSFMSFEKMDEMSQRYSEDMEATAEIGKQVAVTGASIGGLAALGFLGYMFAMGKLPTHKIIKFLSNLSLKKESNIRQFIDKAYAIINNDKTLKRAFNKTLSPSHTEKALNTLENNAELQKLFNQAKTSIIGFESPSLFTIIQRLSTEWKNLLKDSFLAKWSRKLLAEGMLAYGRAKEVIPKTSIPIINTFMGKKGNSFYQTYKTLINTSAVLSIPFFGAVIGIPYAFCSWLTNIQKKSGKIGIMQAMNSLDNNALYVNPNFKPQVMIADNSQPQNTTQNHNMLENFMNNAKIRQPQSA